MKKAMDQRILRERQLPNSLFQLIARPFPTRFSPMCILHGRQITMRSSSATLRNVVTGTGVEEKDEVVLKGIKTSGAPLRNVITQDGVSPREGCAVLGKKVAGLAPKVWHNVVTNETVEGGTPRCRGRKKEAYAYSVWNADAHENGCSARQPLRIRNLFTHEGIESPLHKGKRVFSIA
jgi:hypothetical protein